uniref:R13L1/DRL21-like LRR repeat region domain-containing protein n=1 Tax=Aegilops tauschii TaxID=37682 RepID=M8BPR1_AEGTA
MPSWPNTNSSSGDSNSWLHGGGDYSDPDEHIYYPIEDGYPRWIRDKAWNGEDEDRLIFCKCHQPAHRYVAFQGSMVLCVKKCQVESLPSDFNRLINLWRFESQGFKYGPNIRGFPEEYYGVNIDAAEDKFGLGCRFIKNVKQLRGHLVINNVYKLSKYHSADANLKNKDCFDKVTLQWGKWSTKFSEENKIEVLADLQPPASTKSLVLEGYPGVSRPSWFEPQSLPSLTSVSFLHCDRLRNRILNGSTGFSSLTDLIIDGCCRLSSLKQLLHPTYLPVIKRIALMNCRYLVSVPTERFGDFRCLEIFKLLNCGKINSESLTAPSLKKLMLDGSCGNLTDNIQCCSLTNFFLTGSSLTSIQLQMWNLPALQELHIKGGSLTSIGQSGHVFTNLTSLTISWCDKLSTIDGLLEKEYLPAIESITFADCMSLSMHGERSIPGHLWSSTLSSLQELQIHFCWDLVSIGGADDISEIQNVWIEDCRNLKGIEQPLKRGSFFIAKKKEQPVKTSSKSVWCMPTGD